MVSTNLGSLTCHPTPKLLSVNPNALSRVVLTSSMWDAVGEDLALLQTAFDHEYQLKDTEDFWGTLIQAGSHVMRWTGERESALGAIGHLMDLNDRHGSIVLKIQKELVDKEMNLDDTDAGRAVQDGFVRALANHRGELQDLTSQFRQALQEGNNKIAVELRENLNATNAHIEKIKSSQLAIGTDLQRLAEDKTQEYSELLTQVRQEHRLMMDTINQCREDYQRLVEEERANLEALKEAQRENELERLALAKRSPVSVYSESEPDEMSNLDEVDEELQAQFDEEKWELEGRKEELDKRMRRDNRKMLVKKNSIPMLSILAGVGATVGGGLLINPGLIVAGVGLITSGASKLNFSRKEKKEEEQELLPTDSLVSLTSTVE